jgi:hypothetical protein
MIEKRGEWVEEPGDRKSAFVVGRSTKRGTMLLFVGLIRSPIVGPWTVRAVVSAN